MAESKSHPRWPSFGCGLISGAALGAAWKLYSGRSREREPSLEGLDDAEVARGFDRVAAMPQMRLLRWYVSRRALRMVRSGSALDLGCGPGHLALRLARQAPGLDVTGLDLADDMLSRATSCAQAAGIGSRVRFRKGNVEDIPFSDTSFDLVVSTLSLHHWAEPVAALDEIARVLKPGGAFIIFDLRRDLAAPLWLLLWFATHVVVPAALRRANEPLGSRDAAYTPGEAELIAERSGLTGWRVSTGPLWLTIEGRLP